MVRLESYLILTTDIHLDSITFRLLPLKICTKDIINKYLDLVAARDVERMQQERLRAKLQGNFKTSENISEKDELEQQRRENCQEEITEKSIRWGNRKVKIKSVKLLNRQGDECYSFKCGEPADIVIQYSAEESLSDLVFGIGVFRDDNLHCYGTNMEIDRFEIGNFPLNGIVECKIENINMLEGRYFLDVGAHAKGGIPYDYWTKCLDFTVVSRLKDIGVARLEHKWHVKELMEEHL